MLWQHKPYEEILEEINSNLPNDVRIISMKMVAASFNAKNSVSFREYQYLFPLKTLKNAEFNADLVSEINKIAGHFHGTHSFHNYTRDILPNKPEGKRYIIKFEVDNEPILFENCTYLKFLITGQSFLYHQIRKMVGMTLAVYSSKHLLSDIQKSFEDDAFLVPLAPAEGLSLHRVHFAWYNKKQSHRPVVLTPEEEVLVDNFYKSSILPTIHSAYGVFENWVASELFSQISNEKHEEIEASANEPI